MADQQGDDNGLQNKREHQNDLLVSLLVALPASKGKFSKIISLIAQFGAAPGHHTIQELSNNC
jgi:hypothetical protein